MDPLAGTPWSAPRTVEGFVNGDPNRTLMAYAAQEHAAGGARRVALDVGCGAARNALPLAVQGWRVLGVDLSQPMLVAARDRAAAQAPLPLAFAMAPMEALPVRDHAVDLTVVHGIWNLATSDGQFRAAVAEAARVTRSGGALFVFTFSRTTLPDDAQPVPGETLTFTQFSGRPQVFVTRDQLYGELAAAGFEPDAALPLVEHNAPANRALRVATGGPVIYEAAFRRRITT